MTKRVINGKAYNTNTATHVANAQERYEDNNASHLVKYDLYRTKGGAFFLVETDVMIGADDDRDDETTFFPLSYDQAYSFIQGFDLSLRPSTFISGSQVDIFAEDIFPTIPEAADNA